MDDAVAPRRNAACSRKCGYVTSITVPHCEPFPPFANCPWCGAAMAILDAGVAGAPFRPQWVAGPRPGEAMWMDEPNSYAGVLPIDHPDVVAGRPFVPEPYNGLVGLGAQPQGDSAIDYDRRQFEASDNYWRWKAERESARAKAAESLVAEATPPPPILRVAAGTVVAEVPAGWRARFVAFIARMLGH